jgi:hypothetical protein
MPRTPRRVNRAVRHLLKRMELESTPEWIAIEPRDDAVMKECTENVARAIAEHGGTTRLGWMIWEEDFMIEAIFHAVWEHPDGRTVDVTPQDIPVDRIMFVPDLSLQYQGRQIPNVRLNISGMIAVDDLIRLNELKFAIQNVGDRADQHRIMITPTESNALQWLETYRDAMSGALSAGMTDDSPCFCDSGRPYRHCHASILKESFAKLESLISTIEEVPG